MSYSEMPESNSRSSGLFYGYIIVAVSALILAISLGTRSAFGIFFKPMLNDFGWTRAMTSGAFSLSIIVEGIVGIFMGGLNDKFGPRVVLMICGVLAGVGYFLMSGISSLWQLYLFYGVIIGIGLGGCYVPLVSTVARWFVRRRSLMTGIVSGGAGVGTLVLPLLANLLISTCGWRQSFLIMGILVMLIVVLCAWFLRRDPAQKGLRPYGAGDIESVVTGDSVRGYSFREAVFTPQFWIVYFMLFCYGFTSFSVMVHLVPHVTDLGISSGSAATILSVTGAVSVIGSLLLGNVADRVGNRRIYFIGYLGLALTFIGLLLSHELWVLYLLAVLFSLATGGEAAVESPLVAGLFGLRSHGLIYGVMGTGFMVGASLGPYFTGYIYDVNHSYSLAFIVCIALCVIGVALTLLLKPARDRHRVIAS